MSCPACNGEEGARHSCEASGTATAELAYDAGAVAPVSALPLFDVDVRFTVAALEEDDVKGKLVPLVTDLLGDDDVVDAQFTVTRR